MFNPPAYVFFGTSHFSVIVLRELIDIYGYPPALVVTTPDRPKGRKLTLTPSEIGIFAQERCIPTLKPEKLKDAIFEKTLHDLSPEFYIVVSYGKIIPKNILDIAPLGALNVHPSLLPRYRGPSPVHSQILQGEKNVGVTIMLLDEAMDHGPILLQGPLLEARGEAPSSETHWNPDRPLHEEALEEILARRGALLLVQALEKYRAGTLMPQKQEHEKALYTRKLTKEDGLLDLNDPPLINYRKIAAYKSWPRAYFFIYKDNKPLRVVVTDAELIDGKLKIQKVIPEGRKEMRYDDWIKNIT